MSWRCPQCGEVSATRQEAEVCHAYAEATPVTPIENEPAIWSQRMWRADCTACGKPMGEGNDRDYFVWPTREEAVEELRAWNAVVTSDLRVFCESCLERHPRLVRESA